jgi:hypothetical protein
MCFGKARLTDVPKTQGKNNLTIQNLPALVDAKIKDAIKVLVDGAVNEAQFCRDWRNRHIAHRDLELAVNEAAAPLAEASRTRVNDALGSIVNVLNALGAHYTNSETYFKLGVGAGGAVSLLYVIDEGVRAQAKRLERLPRGEMDEDDRHRDL